MHYINPELKYETDAILNIVNQFCKPWQINNVNHTFVYFKKLKEPLAGECRRGLSKYSIVIDPPYWNTLDEDLKFELIAHEYSHCLLFKQHVNDPTNYMYDSLVNLTKEEVKEQFIEDLKKHCGNRNVK